MVIPPTQLIDFGDGGSLVAEGTPQQKGLVPTLVFKAGGAAGGGGGAIVLGSESGAGGGGGRENRYSANARRMDSRPLPSIPDLRLSGSWKMVATSSDAGGSVTALQRMDSSGGGGGAGRGGGHRSSGQTRMVIRSVVCPDGFRFSSSSGAASAFGPRPGSACAVYSAQTADAHQYFVLEPEEEPTGTGRDLREMVLVQDRQTMPRFYGGGIQSGGDVMITSIHEIPMRSPLGVSTGSIGRPV